MQAQAQLEENRETKIASLDSDENLTNELGTLVGTDFFLTNPNHKMDFDEYVPQDEPSPETAQSQDDDYN